MRSPAWCCEHNYQQNRALAAAWAQAAQMLHVHAAVHPPAGARTGKIKRRLDVLPSEREIAERRSAGTGLAIPEFSVLLAHTKIDVTQRGARPPTCPTTRICGTC